MANIRIQKGSRGSAARGAFTLVEILIVVIIIGLLAAIVVPQFSQATDDARVNMASSLQKTVELQLEVYRMRYGAFPTSTLMEAAPTDATLGDSFGVLVDNGYLKTAPVNPYTQGTDIPTHWTYDATNGTVTVLTTPALP